MLLIDARKLFKNLLREKVEDHIEWMRYDEAQELITAAHRLWYWKTANELQAKLDEELQIRNIFKPIIK